MEKRRHARGIVAVPSLQVCGRGICEAFVALSLSCVLLGASANAVGQPMQTDSRSRVDTREAVALLEKWANELESNYEAIKSWSGEYTFLDTMFYEGVRASEFLSLRNIEMPKENPRTLYCRERGRISFAVDAREEKLYSSIEVIEEPEVNWDDGESIAFNMGRFHQKSILTPGEFLHFRPTTIWGPTNKDKVVDSDGAIGRVAYRDPPAQGQPGNWGTLVNPLQLLMIPEPPWGQLRATADHLRNPSREFKDYAPSLFSVGQKANESYVLVCPYKLGDGTLIQETRISTSNGATIISVKDTVSEGFISGEVDLTYEVLDGIRIPHSVRRTAYNPDGSMHFQRELEVVRAVLNQPIDPATFTYEQLGLKSGDRFWDRMLGVEYTYRDGELIPAGSGRLSKDLPEELSPEIEEIPSMVTSGADPGVFVSEEDEPASGEGKAYSAIFLIVGLCLVLLCLTAVYLRGKRSAEP